jgi:hypothetical protein
VIEIDVCALAKLIRNANGNDDDAMMIDDDAIFLMDYANGENVNGCWIDYGDAPFFVGTD